METWPNTTSYITEWEAIVYTGDKAYAATGSKLEMRVYGTEDDTGRIRLHGNFVRHTTDTTTLYASIGEPYKITVYSDGAGTGNGWYLGWVRYYIYFFHLSGA